MSRLLPALTDVVPHRDKMLLLDAIESWDALAHSLDARFVPRLGMPFVDEKRQCVSAIVLLEVMAQAAAALKGCEAGHPVVGLLLGTRLLDLAVSSLSLGSVCRVSVRLECEAGSAAAYLCETRALASGSVLASAVLNVCRVEDEGAMV